MRVALHRVESDCLKAIYDNNISKEETLELVVPDVCADIGKILDVRGQFLLSSHKAKTDEIVISASVEATVIYAADDTGKVQIVSAVIPFNHTIPVEGATENIQTVARCKLRSIDARTLNPRKLLLRANAFLSVCAYVQDGFAIWDKLSEDSNVPVHILQKDVEHVIVTGVREKSFVVSDEYRLPEEKGQNLKMLCSNTEIGVQDAKSVGNKVVIKAEAVTNAIFYNEADGSLFDNTFSSQFSQIIEVDTYGDNIEDIVTIQLKDAEFTCIPGRENGYTVSAQLHMSAQAVCREKKNMVFVADAYSNQYKVTPEIVDTKIVKCPSSKYLRLSMKGKVAQKTELYEIMYTSASSVFAESEGNNIIAKAVIGGVGKSENGDFEPINLELKAEENIELLKGQGINIISVFAEQPIIIGSPNNAEVSISVNVEYCVGETTEICAVCGIEADEECCLNNQNSPSLVVVCSEKDTDLWNLAKKYGSTMDMIKSANTIDGDFSINRRPLLIPRVY